MKDIEDNNDTLGSVVVGTKSPMQRILGRYSAITEKKAAVEPAAEVQAPPEPVVEQPAEPVAASPTIFTPAAEVQPPPEPVVEQPAEPVAAKPSLFAPAVEAAAEVQPPPEPAAVEQPAEPVAAKPSLFAPAAEPAAEVQAPAEPAAVEPVVEQVSVPALAVEPVAEVQPPAEPAAVEQVSVPAIANPPVPAPAPAPAVEPVAEIQPPPEPVAVEQVSVPAIANPPVPAPAPVVEPAAEVQSPEVPDVEQEVVVEAVINQPDAESADNFQGQVPAVQEPVPMSQSVGKVKNVSDIDGETGKSLRASASDLQTSGSEGSEGDGSEDNRGRMGDRMVSMGIITEDQLNVALQEKKISGKMLGEILVSLGFIEEDELSVFLAETSGFGVFDPRNTIVDGDALSLIEKNLAVQHQVLPILIDGAEVHVAMSDPYDVLALDILRRSLPTGAQIKQMVTTSAILSEAIDAAYGYASSIKDILDELEGGGVQDDVTSLSEEDAFSHPLVRLVNALIFDAVKIGVSDLHFEPEDNFVRVRYRLDGVLFTAQTLHKQHWSGISQRIKIMSEMNIADKLGAQDGRFGLNVGGREADFRVSSLPTVHGENIVLRVLDKSASIMPLANLGFSEANMAKIDHANSKPEGIIIVTGPTGSGKTTSLYSMLNEINDVEVNIQTLEDPVEYSLPMIRQTHVREGVLDFGDGIKALLRQDPDIIFIGEIRDQTTAEMALKAAMTGHQVYTSLHTNDSFGALPRLLDLGMKPGMLAGAITAVFAQRLARRLCGGCKVEYSPAVDECELLGIDPSNPIKLYKKRDGGCEMCASNGYKGRVAVVEILLFDEELNEIVARNESKAELKAVAVKKGFKSMRDDGILKVIDGVTDVEALSKVVDFRN